LDVHSGSKTALSRQYNIDKLKRIQRAACAGATGAMRSCPSAALNVLLKHSGPSSLQTEGNTVLERKANRTQQYS